MSKFPDGLWGAKTQRALENIEYGCELKIPRQIIHAFGHIKRCIAKVNLVYGLDQKVGNAIMLAADEVARGELDGHFPLGLVQVGNGTIINFNANEGSRNFRWNLIPQNDVNGPLCPTYTFSSIMHVAAATQITSSVKPSLARLHDFMGKGAALM